MIRRLNAYNAEAKSSFSFKNQALNFYFIFENENILILKYIQKYFNFSCEGSMIPA